MKEDPVFNEPMRELILSMSAWRRLKAKAMEFENRNHILGPILLHYMAEAWSSAKEDLKDSEKDLMEKIRKAKP